MAALTFSQSLFLLVEEKMKYVATKLSYLAICKALIFLTFNPTFRVEQFCMCFKSVLYHI